MFNINRLKISNNRVTKQTAFTLVEMVILVILIGILAAIGNGYYSSLGAFKARSFYEEIISGFRHTQAMAVNSGCLTKVELNTATKTFTFKQKPNSDCTGTYGNIKSPQSSGPYTIVGESNITITPSLSFPIYFNAMGQVVTSDSETASAAADLTITISDNEDFSKIIYLYSDSGLINDE